MVCFGVNRKICDVTGVLQIQQVTWRILNLTTGPGFDSFSTVFSLGSRSRPALVSVWSGLETQSLGLGLGLETLSLGLGLGLGLCCLDSNTT